MKKLYILFLLMLLPMLASAADKVEIDGIYYNLNSSGDTKTAEVTQNPNRYSGDIVIPETITYNDVTYSVTSIGNSAFLSCSGLTSVTIPNSVTSIGLSPFSGCSGLTSIVVEDGNTVYDSRDNSNAIIETSTNTLIAGCKKSIIPNSVISIGNSAFHGCRGLTSITIPKNVTSIDYRAFGSNMLVSLIVESENPVYDSRDNCNAIIETRTNTLITGCQNTKIPNSVAHIGNSAFNNCNGLKTLIIPEGVKTIGSSAFSSCFGLEGVELPSSLTNIGYAAFRHCTKMKTVISHITNPGGVLSSDDVFDSSSAMLFVPVGTLAWYQAISGWTKFSNIEEGGLVTVDNLNYTYSFSSKTATLVRADYENYSSITIPSKINIEGEDYNVVRIGSYAFKQFTILNSISLSDGIKYIDDQAFYQTSITEINLPSSLESIGVSAFWNCNGLKTLIIPEGVKSIDSYAFRYCYSLQTLELPSSLEIISPYAFGSCTRLTNIVSHIQEPFSIQNNVFDISTRNNGVETITPSSATLYVPQNSIDAYKATEGWSSFKNILPLEDMLANIEFADAKVKEICVANWDTNGDGELSMLEASLVNDLGNVFAQNNDIKSFDELRYFKGLTSMKATWFYGCYFLSSITIPENVKEIENLLFYYCHFKSIGVDENNQNYMVDEGVLYNKAKSILVNFPTYREGEFTIPDGVTTINEYAFCGSQLSSVTIPDGVRTIKYSGFSGCQLSSIVIPKSVISIASSAFSNCSKVSSIVVDEDNPVYDSRDNCNAIIETESNQLIQGSISTVIPQSVTSIGQYAFSFRNLLSIDIPNGVQTIETLAFMGAGLSSVKIPASITSIESQAFLACEQLKTVTVDGKEPCLIEQNTFPYRTESTLYVPTGCKAAYEAAEYWKDFKEIIEMDETAPITIGKSGKASYCGDKSLDFSYSEEVKAYIATGFDKDEGIIWLTRVKDVPAGVPVLIKGDANKTYDVPVTESENSYYTNMFVGNTTGETIKVGETEGDKVNYYLSGDGTFKSVNKSVNIGNNKSYLQLPGTFEASVTGATQTVTIKSSGKASYAAPVDLDFTNVEGLKAFSATGYDKSSKTIWLTRVMKVQKGEGVLLKGDAKDYEIPSAAVQSSYMNMFVGNTSGDKIQVQETSADGSLTNFYLNGEGSFVSVNGFVNIGNNKCYLELPTSMVAVAASTRGAEANYILEEPEMIKLPISFRSIDNDGDGTTGIKDQSSKFNAPSDAYYTLQGQRVAKPGKGLYIRNGKKVVIK